MTDEVNDLIKRLRKQAKTYEDIDGGTGFGWDKDAQNIRDVIKLVTSFEKCWNELESSVRARCEDMELMKTTSRIANILKIEANILHDMRNIGSDIFGGCNEPEENDNIESNESELGEVNGCV